MKNKKLFTGIVALAMAANMALVGAAMADTTSASVAVTAGSLTFTVPASVNFGSITSSGSSTALVAQNVAINVVDLRGGTAGFSLDLVANNLVGETDALVNIPYTNLKWDTDAGAALSAVSGTVDSVSPVVAGITALTAFAGTGTPSNSISILDGDANYRNGTWDVTAQLSGDVDAYPKPQTYSGNLVFTLTASAG